MMTYQPEVNKYSDGGKYSAELKKVEIGLDQIHAKQDECQY